MLNTSLFDIRPAETVRSLRSSSYDRAGGNIDFQRIRPGGRLTILDVNGPGIVTHLWFALQHIDPLYLRKLVIRAWWDGEKQPSLNCPVGDFFGVGHGVAKKYKSLLMNFVRGGGELGGGTGMNCYIPMPFAKAARIEVINESPTHCMACYYQVDWLQVKADAVAGAGRFHAQWRRENPTRQQPHRGYKTFLEFGRFGANLSSRYNYEIADLAGRGRLLGMNLSIDNLDTKFLDGNLNGFGEGDEMIFIDGKQWPPALHGTGTEDYFTDAWGMTNEEGLYAGTTWYQEATPPTKRQKGTCYRFHVLDPIYFRKSLHFSIEHGHANHQRNDLASTVYWYQEEPHQSFVLPPVAARLPVPEPKDPQPDEEHKVIVKLGGVVNAFYDIFIEGNRRQVRQASVGLASRVLGKAFGLCGDFRQGKITTATVLAEIAPYEEALRKITGHVRD